MRFWVRQELYIQAYLCQELGCQPAQPTGLTKQCALRLQLHTSLTQSGNCWLQVVSHPFSPPAAHSYPFLLRQPHMSPASTPLSECMSAGANL